MIHRVTCVSRVLAPVGSVQQPLEQALASLNIASNYELIRTLEPFVRGRTAGYHDFVAAARNAVTTYLPDLLPHTDDILAFPVLYDGVGDVPKLAGRAARRVGHARPGSVGGPDRAHPVHLLVHRRVLSLTVDAVDRRELVTHWWLTWLATAASMVAWSAVFSVATSRTFDLATRRATSRRAHRHGPRVCELPCDDVAGVCCV